MSATEVNFAWAGFAAAMISNFAFVFRNIFSKQMQKDIGATLAARPAAACVSPCPPARGGGRPRTLPDALRASRWWHLLQASRGSTCTLG